MSKCGSGGATQPVTMIRAAMATMTRKETAIIKLLELGERRACVDLNCFI